MHADGQQGEYKRQLLLVIQSGDREANSDLRKPKLNFCEKAALFIFYMEIDETEVSAAGIYYYALFEVSV